MNRALRRTAPIALALSSALLLAGCSGSGETPAETTDAAATAAPCFEAKSGSVSDAVEVAGDFGATPTATFSAPLEAKELETSVVIEGDGDEAKSGTSANVMVTMFSGTSGEQLVSQEVPLAIGDTTLLDAFRSAIDCQPYGTRTVTVAPASALYGDTGNEALGVAAGDTVVIVADVVEEYVEPTPEPLPTPAEWTENVPEVTFNGDKTPTVVFPQTDASGDLQLKVLKQGDGETVEDGDQVTVQYAGFTWDDGQLFDDSYSRGEPATFSTSGVIQGFGAALVGQKVGTQLIVTIPPALGYGAEPSESNELAGRTLVFVVEITDTQHS